LQASRDATQAQIAGHYWSIGPKDLRTLQIVLEIMIVLQDLVLAKLSFAYQYLSINRW